MNLSEKTELNDLGERLQWLRRQRGISQEELAGAIGVSRQAVSKWESRQAQPELDKAVALAEYFGVSLDWLLRGKETAAPQGAQNDPVPLVPQAPQILPQALVTVATALNYIGLLLAWAIWDYWQISLSVAVGAGFMILGLAVLAVAVQLGPDKDKLVRRFWRYNIWPLAYLGIVAAYTTVCGRLTAPVIEVEFWWGGPGEILFAVGAWLIICICVWRWTRKARK